MKQKLHDSIITEMVCQTMFMGDRITHKKSSDKPDDLIPFHQCSMFTLLLGWGGRQSFVLVHHFNCVLIGPLNET